ncbi:MAG: hypothetical protein IT395_00385 [Candidatus Omnitrophica bacterium]|nr:hypothetical protein [Candidatus Omnitrophota bacterium]
MRNILSGIILITFLAVLSSGCSTSMTSDDDSMIYKMVNPEPDWIRNGEPIEFEGELWYPRDTIDILTDSEMLPLGEYRGIAFYLQKIDVRPYDRLYTKFGKNKFRVFEIKTQNDSSHRAF